MEEIELIRERAWKMHELKQGLLNVRLNVLIFLFGTVVGVLTNIIAASVPSVNVTIFDVSFNTAIPIAAGTLMGLFIIFVFWISYISIPREFYEIEPLPPKFSELFSKLVQKNAEYRHITNWILNHFFHQTEYTAGVSQTPFVRIERRESDIKLSIKYGRWVKGFVFTEVFAFPAYVGASVRGFSMKFSFSFHWYSYLNPRIIERYFNIRQMLSTLSLACTNRIIQDIANKLEESKRNK